MRDFDTVFNKLAAHTEMAGDFVRRAARQNKFSQGGIRNQSRCTHRIGRFFIVMVIVPSKNSAGSRPGLRRNDGQTVRRMS